MADDVRGRRAGSPDPTTVDLAVLTRARTVMLQLLLACVLDPLDSHALERAWSTQRQLRNDLVGVRTRLLRSVG